MTQQTQDHGMRASVQAPRQTARPAGAAPVFKPVALPALAAAVQAAKLQPRRQPVNDLPAFLRKEAMQG